MSVADSPASIVRTDACALRTNTMLLEITASTETNASLTEAKALLVATPSPPTVMFVALIFVALIVPALIVAAYKSPVRKLLTLTSWKMRVPAFKVFVVMLVADILVACNSLVLTVSG